MTPPEAPATQRLFFALWPNAAVRTALADLARVEARGNGRQTLAENLHLTLAFLGNLPAERRACMEAAAAGVTGSAFELVIDRLGYWPRPRILWAGTGAVPAPLADLVRDLNLALADCGYQPERRGFQAHVTLARKAQRTPDRIAVDPIVWPVDAFCLVVSEAGERGSRYRVLRHWPLAR